jgi:hypothetical protein
MRKFLLSVCTVIGFSMLSQAQIKLGIKAGESFSNQRINASTGSMFAGDRFKGYHAGVIADINLGKNFYLQPQLLFSRKGATHFSSVDSLATKVRFSYIELPVNIMYKADVAFGKVFVGTGASFSYAVGGNEQYGGNTKKLYSGPVKNWKRGDISMNVTAGLELNNGLFVSANWQKGLIDIYKPVDASVKNKSVSVSVGYLLILKGSKGK